MTVKINETIQKTETPAAPRVSFSGQRLHFVRSLGSSPRSPRLRLTAGLVGRR